MAFTGFFVGRAAKVAATVRGTVENVRLRKGSQPQSWPQAPLTFSFPVCHPAI